MSGKSKTQKQSEGQEKNDTWGNGRTRLERIRERKKLNNPLSEGEKDCKRK